MPVTNSTYASKYNNQSTSSNNNPTVTIFFIPGNPGLIGYYHVFLSLLTEQLESISRVKSRSRLFQVYGHSLGGFEFDTNADTKLYDIEEQITFVEGVLNKFMAMAIDDDSDHVYGGPYPGLDESESKNPKVIVIGHSVGAYIAMEILRRHRETKRKNKKLKNGNLNTNINNKFDVDLKEGSNSNYNACSKSSSSLPSSSCLRDASASTIDPDFDIVGGIMLFPTVVDIAKSAAGQKLMVSFIIHNIFLLLLLP